MVSEHASSKRGMRKMNAVGLSRLQPPQHCVIKMLLMPYIVCIVDLGIGGNSYDYESNIDDGYNILLSKIM